MDFNLRFLIVARDVNLQKIARKIPKYVQHKVLYVNIDESSERLRTIV